MNYAFKDNTATYLIDRYNLKDKTETELIQFIDSILEIPPATLNPPLPDTVFSFENLTDNGGKIRKLQILANPKYQIIGAKEGVGFMSMAEIDRMLKKASPPTGKTPPDAPKTRPPSPQLPPPSPVPYNTPSAPAPAPAPAPLGKKKGRPYELTTIKRYP